MNATHNEARDTRRQAENPGPVGQATKLEVLYHAHGCEVIRGRAPRLLDHFPLDALLSDGDSSGIRIRTAVMPLNEVGYYAADGCAELIWNSECREVDMIDALLAAEFFDDGIARELRTACVWRAGLNPTISGGTPDLERFDAAELTVASSGAWSDVKQANPDARVFAIEMNLAGSCNQTGDALAIHLCYDDCELIIWNRCMRQEDRAVIVGADLEHPCPTPLYTKESVAVWVQMPEAQPDFICATGTPRLCARHDPETLVRAGSLADGLVIEDGTQYGEWPSLLDAVYVRLGNGRELLTWKPDLPREERLRTIVTLPRHARKAA